MNLLQDLLCSSHISLLASPLGNAGPSISYLSSASVDDVAVIDDLLSKLEECAKNVPPVFQMKPIQFEKVGLFQEQVHSFSEQPGLNFVPASINTWLQSDSEIHW